MKKADTFKVTNQLTSSSEAHLPDGFLFLGNEYTNNNSLEENETLPPKTYLGTSETRGNVSRSMVDLNNNGPIKFNYTNDDKKLFMDKLSGLFVFFPFISKFPWLTPVQEWSNNTQVSIESNVPIYKCLGKGLGEIHFFKTGTKTLGNREDAGSSTMDISNGITCNNTQQSEWNKPVIYPYSGTIYSGNLVQLVSEIDQETGIRETKVIPFQTGRGILYDADNIGPSVTLASEFYTHRPYGSMSWDPDGTFPFEPLIEPYLAPGAEPGESNMCVGMVLDTFTPNNPSRRLFKYENENAMNVEPYTPWYNHSAPFTVQAESVEPGAFLSPLNSAGTRWSPWPVDYAYQENQPIPVLTKGITTARIGAAYNVATQSYAIPVKGSADVTEWLSAFSIPLFEGEEIQAGSYVYAAVKGNAMTLGPQLKDYGNPYGLPLRDLKEGEDLLFFGPTVWDPWIDSTGSIGWTGTPGLSFSNIPDQGFNIVDGLGIGPGLELNGTLPYLNQANQGSIIIHPITTNGLTPTIGANGLLRFYPEFEEKNNITYPNQYYVDRAKSVKGISGRCNLVQSPPEKSIPIGVVLETVRGKGKWTYTGLITNDRIITDAELTEGGGSLTDIIESGDPSAPTRGGTGTTTVIWTTNIITPPNLGTITGIPTVVADGPEADGTILTVTNAEAVAATHTPFWKDNNASLLYTLAGPTLSLHEGGSGYSTSTSVTTHNLSLNNLYIREDTVAGVITEIANSLSADYPTDTSRYNDGSLTNSQVILLQDGVPENNTSIVRVETLPYSVTVEDGGTGYSPDVPNLLFESQILGKANPEISIDSVTSGVINTFTMIDYGVGNLPEDIILITDGDENSTFAMPELPYGEQEINMGAPEYVNGNTYVVMKSGTSIVDASLTVEVRALNEFIEEQNSPTLVTFGTLGVPVDGEVYNMVYDAVTHVDPWYVPRRSAVRYFSTGPELKVHRGGSNYTTATGVETYNITANSLQFGYDFITDSSAIKIPESSRPIEYSFIKSRYTFGNNDGTLVNILEDGVTDLRQELLLDENDLDSLITINGGSGYTTGTNYFQTQRTDQVNPTVDIITDVNGFVKRVKITDVGTNNQPGDLIIVKQEGSDLNAIFIYNEDTIPNFDFPPFINVPGGIVPSDANAWTRYKDVIESAENLLDKQILIELRPNMNDNTLENIYPVATGNSQYPPQDTPSY